MRFNPLHCGAVVALDELEDSWEQDELVSIPFIAGQWSLPRSPCGGRGGRRSFNPLHCGAVVALMERRQRCSRFHHVSIPFIAGQWSLNFSVFRWVSFEDRFQSPSLRGSGRFEPLGSVRTSARPEFQSPSLRGSGRFFKSNLPN